MDIKKKLEYYKKQTAASTPFNPVQEEALSTPVKVLKEHFNARILGNSASPVLKIERRIVPESLPSGYSLKRLSKNELTEPVAIEKTIFFDLETTGLSGGAGTYPFLLGFGFFEKNVFVVWQYFLPDFGREYLFFKDLQPLLESRSVLISYNGKSYDLPLLKTRAILNRLPIDFERFKHIDLLHLVRRVWRDSQDNCDLGSVESKQLNITRQNDIPGYAIPAAYTRFIYSGVVHEMLQVIEHNYQDIVTLQKLIARLSSIEENPAVLNDVSALMRLSRLAFELNDRAFFLKIEHALRQHGELPPQFEFLKSLLHKRSGEWEVAVPLWEGLLQHRPFALSALEELAKYHEHIRRDLQAALGYTNRALKQLSTLEVLNPYQVDEQQKQSFLHRLKRLQTKMQKQGDKADENL